MNNVLADEVIIGKGTYIHPTAMLQGLDGKAQRIAIGDQVYIGENVRVFCNNFSLGDYSKIHHDTNIHGYKSCSIGHNAWIGQFCIIDCIGGTVLGNNCCVGAATHLWSHMKFGDTLEGCRFLHQRPLTIGNDVWFGGHCTIAPIVAYDKSMALAGSVVTHNMLYNQVYAGVPARPVTDTLGPQFADVPPAKKLATMQHYLTLFGASNQLGVVAADNQVGSDEQVTYFSIESRRYTKRGTTEEIAFMKFLLPEKAKFTPF